MLNEILDARFTNAVYACIDCRNYVREEITMAPEPWMIPYGKQLKKRSKCMP